MMSDMEKLNVMLRNGNSNPIERKLVDAVEQSSVQRVIKTDMHQSGDYRECTCGNDSFRQNDV